MTERAQQVLTMELASIIVHEATHGRVEDAGIRYHEGRRERIEKLCRRQERQFLGKAVPDFCDMKGNRVDWVKVKNFEQNREFYKESWAQSRWSYIKEILRNCWQEITEKPVEEEEEEEAAATWRERHQHFAKLAESYQAWTDGMIYARGAYHWQAMNFRESRVDLRSFLSRNPDHKHARCCLAMILYKMWRWEESLVLWKEAHAQDEEYAASWIAYALLNLDRHEEALEWLEKETETADETYVACLRARILIGLGREDEALQSYDAVLLDEEGEGEEFAFNSDEFSMLAERALLLRRLGKQARFRKAKKKLFSNAEQYWASCADAPKEIEAFVLKTYPDISEPGILCVGARLLICPEFAGQPGEEGYLEGIADRLLENMDSDSNEYEALYQRSLLRHNEDYPWREVPENLTNGRQVFIVDMNLDRLFLPGEMLTGNYVTCMIVPWGDNFTAYLQMKEVVKTTAEQEILVSVEI